MDENHSKLNSNKKIQTAFQFTVKILANSKIMKCAKIIKKANIIMDKQFLGLYALKGFIIAYILCLLWPLKKERQRGTETTPHSSECDKQQMKRPSY